MYEISHLVLGLRITCYAPQTSRADLKFLPKAKIHIFMLY